MSWIQTSVMMMGRVPLGAYLRRFGLKPASGTDDLNKFVQRVQAQGKASEDFGLKRGKVRGHMKGFIYPETEPLDFLADVYPEQVARIGVAPLAVGDRTIVRDVVSAILEQNTRGMDRERLCLRIIDPAEGEVDRWMSPHALIISAGVIWVRVYDHQINAGRELPMACILDVVDSKEDPTQWGRRDSDWSQDGVLELRLKGSAQEHEKNALRRMFGITGEVRRIEGRMAVLEHLKSHLMSSEANAQVEFEVRRS